MSPPPPPPPPRREDDLGSVRSPPGEELRAPGPTRDWDGPTSGDLPNHDLGAARKLRRAVAGRSTGHRRRRGIRNVAPVRRNGRSQLGGQVERQLSSVSHRDRGRATSQRHHHAHGDHCGSSHTNRHPPPPPHHRNHHRHHPRRSQSPARRGQRLEMPHHLLGSLPPIGGLLLQTAHDQVGQRQGNGVAVFRDGLGHFRHMCHQHHLRALTRERGHTGKQLVGHRPHGVDVRSMIDVIGRLRLFRSHVGRRPESHPDGR